MNAEDRRKLVDSWLIVQRHWWAWEALREQVAEHPEEAWMSILRLVESAECQEMLETIGAGPLEDLMRAYAVSFVARVESESQQNANLRVALGNVWLANREDQVTQRLVSVGCQLVGEQS